MKLKFVITSTKFFKYVAHQFRNYTPHTETGLFVCSMESCTLVYVYMCLCARACT